MNFGTGGSEPPLSTKRAPRRDGEEIEDVKATMPIPSAWLRDLLENEATTGEFLAPDDVVLEEDEASTRRDPSPGGKS